MADRPRDPPWLAFAFGTFHGAFFVTALVLLGQGLGSLAAVLPDIGTFAGLASYGFLWGAAVWTAKRFLRESGPITAKAPLQSGAQGGAAFRWGGVTGVLFLCSFLLALTVGNARELSAVWTALILAAVGSPFAFVVGGLVGVFLAAIDASIVAIASDRVGWRQPRAGE